ncbi:unnamed protein product [Prorocentrum cordatum]|uniref:Uncharacterized protein n=1 Tax=Prorocentrum cordatum TaxID=2364126 RepID=A0ABN9Q3T8_9DINO|nr:unnamed protein product [Polarella glacialis]
MSRRKCEADQDFLSALCKKYSLDIVRFKGSAEIEQTIAEYRDFLVECAAVTTRLGHPDLAKQAKKYAPEKSATELTSWAIAMKNGLSYCAAHRSKDVKKVSPAMAAVIAAMRDQGSSPTAAAQGPSPTAAAPGPSTAAAGPRSPAKKRRSVAGLYGMATPKKSSAVMDLESPELIVASQDAPRDGEAAAGAAEQESSQQELAGSEAARPQEIITIDYATMELKFLSDDGTETALPLAPGPKGFCVARGAAGPIETEVTNVTYAAWEEGLPKRGKPAGKISKKPAAAEQPAIVEKGAVKKKPSMTSAEEEAAVATATADERGAPKGAAAAAMRRPAAARKRPAAATFDFHAQEIGPSMYYKNSHSVALRLAGGGSQIFSIGGKNCTSSKEEMKEVGEDVRQQLNDGTLLFEDAWEYARSHLAWAP